MRILKILFILLASFPMLKGSTMSTDMENLQEEIIGTWGNLDNVNAPLLFITKNYVIVFTKYNKVDYKGQIPSDSAPKKYAYKITKESSDYYLRSSFWYKIRRGKNIILDSNIRFLGLFIVDKGVELQKLQDKEVLLLLTKYKVNYSKLKESPIYPHQDINGISQEKDDAGILLKIKNNSLPKIIEEFTSSKI